MCRRLDVLPLHILDQCVCVCPGKAVPGPDPRKGNEIVSIWRRGRAVMNAGARRCQRGDVLTVGRPPLSTHSPRLVALCVFFHRCESVWVCVCVHVSYALCLCCSTSSQAKELLLTVGQVHTCLPLLTVVSAVGSSLATVTYLSTSSEPRRVSGEGVTCSCISDSADSSYLLKQRNNAVPAAVKTVIFCLCA